MNKNLFELDSLFKSNKFDEVVLKTKKLIKKGEIIAPYFNLLGISLDNLGKIYEAEKNFRDAIKKNPNEISYYSNLSKILIKQNKLAEAEEFLNKALEIKPNDTFSLFEFGKLKTAQKDYFKALEFYQNVYKVEKQFPNALFMIGKTYVEISQNNKDEKYKDLAIENLSECSKLFPENSDADFLLSELFDYSKEKKHQKIMLNKYAKIKYYDIRKKAVLLFAIAKSFEDQKKYDQASDFLKIANNEINSTVNQNIILNYSRRFANIKLLFDKIINIKSYNDNKLYDKKIIFIVGMPRSGTTLLHQLLASAKNTIGIGESAIIPSFFENSIFNKEFLTKISKNEKLNKNYLIEISQKLGLDFDKLIELNKNVIIDKNPSNFFWIGFLKLLFPNAKIIIINRNIKDICLSIYKNIFGVKEMDWSYSQDNIIAYVKIYNQVIKYWKKKYGNFIYEIDYEKLINNKIEETKKLFSFCDLQWSEEIFDFYKTGKTIKTASVYQVKKPIYNSSVNINKNYSKHLNFLKDLDN